MRILVVDKCKRDLAFTTRVLGEARHTIVEAASSAEACMAFASRRPDVVVVDFTRPDLCALDFVRQIRSQDPQGNVYIVVLAQASNPKDYELAFGAGADDLVRKPVVREELVARVDGFNRARRWVGARCAGGTSHDLMADNDITRLQAWRSMELCFARELGDMFGLTLSVVTEGKPLPPVALSTQICLSLVAEKLQARIVASGDAASVRLLGNLAFGGESPPEGGLNDMMCEATNLVGGVFKRLAHTEGVELAIGVPSVCTIGAASAPIVASSSFLLASANPRLTLGIRVEVTKRSNELIAASLLCEGMVVARDLRNPAGALLVPAGMHLTTSNIERIVRVLGVKHIVDVQRAA